MRIRITRQGRHIGGIVLRVLHNGVVNTSSVCAHICNHSVYLKRWKGMLFFIPFISILVVKNFFLAQKHCEQVQSDQFTIVFFFVLLANCSRLECCLFLSNPVQPLNVCFFFKSYTFDTTTQISYAL